EAGIVSDFFSVLAAASCQAVGEPGIGCTIRETAHAEPSAHPMSTANPIFLIEPPRSDSLGFRALFSHRAVPAKNLTPWASTFRKTFEWCRNRGGGRLRIRPGPGHEAVCRGDRGRRARECP